MLMIFVLAFCAITFVFVPIPNVGLSPINAELVAMRELTATRGEHMIKLQCPRQRERNVGGYGEGIMDFHSVIWLFHKENTIISAEVHYDYSKYFYFGSTGELAIYRIEFKDAGIYRCILRYKNKATNFIGRQETGSIQLIVLQSYKNLWEEQARWNLMLGVISGAVAVILISSCCILYKFRWRKTKIKGFSSAGLEVEAVMTVAGTDSDSEGGIGIGVGLDNPGLDLELKPHQQQYCGKLAEEERSLSGNPLGNCTSTIEPHSTLTEPNKSDSDPCGSSPESCNLTSHITRV